MPGPIKAGAEGEDVGVAMQIELTVPLDIVCRDFAKASQPTMRAISWTKDFVSRALAFFDRSWESLARRHGWVET